MEVHVVFDFMHLLLLCLTVRTGNAVGKRQRHRVDTQPVGNEYRKESLSNGHQQRLLLSTVRTFNSDPFDESYDCGDRYENIIGGEEAVPFSRPWTVYLKIKFRSSASICTGTLISNQWIITAAHCMFDRGYARALYILVVLGSHDVNNCLKEEPIIYKVTVTGNVFVHRHYYRLLSMNDVALIKLPTPVPRHPHIKPACLPLTKRVPKIGDPCDVAGWGVIDFQKDLMTTKLHMMNVIIVKCISPGGIDKICVGPPPSVKERIQSTCFGDSGGPLLCQIEGIQTLSGVLSGGDEMCRGSNEHPPTFSSVTEYLEWIENTMREN